MAFNALFHARCAGIGECAPLSQGKVLFVSKQPTAWFAKVRASRTSRRRLALSIESLSFPFEEKSHVVAQFR
jgi:hypothetical protein